VLEVVNLSALVTVTLNQVIQVHGAIDIMIYLHITVDDPKSTNRGRKGMASDDETGIQN
jgi:hypothetical protein